MKRPVLIASAVLLLGSTGCHMFSKKKAPAVPVDGPNVAVDTENDFMHRWIDKRTSELVAQGTSADAARAQAVSEFKIKYSYTEAAKQAR
jgi:hypothetical protein